jgi:hypothetical protein
MFPQAVGYSPCSVPNRWPSCWVLAMAVLAFVACRCGGLRPAGRDAAQMGRDLSAGGFLGLGGNGGGGQGGASATGAGGSHTDVGIGGRGSGGQGGGGEGGETVDARIMLLPDGGCGSEAVLWSAVEAAAAPIGSCFALDAAYVESGYYESGYLVVDDEGRVVHNSYFCNSAGSCDTESLKSWLAKLAGYRWPCRAGQTIHYLCRTA